MDKILKINEVINNIVWGWPSLVLLVGIGIVLTLKLRMIQISKIKLILSNTLLKIFTKDTTLKGEITAFQSVATALAATVGTGNISGVAIAISTGGPGSIFWMWISALFGMATKFSEVVLAIVYRERKQEGGYNGGPMYYIKNGLKLPLLAKIFALFTVLASFGIGNMTQSNSISNAIRANFNVDVKITSILITIIAAIVLLGGIERISKVSETLVPIMAFFYIIGSLIVIVLNISEIPNAFYKIFSMAFSKQAAIGGFAGVTFKQIIRQGVARGVFTNEAGLGSAPIAHASAKTDHPVLQGMWGVFEVFMDTMVICTLTALVILVTNTWNSGLSGSELTSYAFNQGFNGGGYIVAIGLTLFAFSTILGWSFYGEKALIFLLGEKYVYFYRMIYIPIIFIGGIGGLKEVWAITDTLNGLMAIPNLIAVFMLQNVVIKMVKHYFKNPEKVIYLEDYEDVISE
ncbi:sodium:alanine symporter family protein [Streptobacillus felis]|uniref:Sodium:alanine symporter family protein n=1 Tax=Streptobacillus felis TaxID=1384509 RepID=A0A7Z0PGI0_9FUSO|nr:sodium:alanine symporter family protein [Streptobacillus felis]NYV28336.1 sodium:alanine symporter family protein [Streptobacillus felis]